MKTALILITACALSTLANAQNNAEKANIWNLPELAKEPRYVTNGGEFLWGVSYSPHMAPDGTELSPLAHTFHTAIKTTMWAKNKAHAMNEAELAFQRKALLAWPATLQEIEDRYCLIQDDQPEEATA